MKQLKLTLLLLTLSIGLRAQSYQLNYGLIRYGLLNGTSVHSVYGQVDLKNVPTGLSTDSLLSVLNGRIRKVAKSVTVAQVTGLQDSLTNKANKNNILVFDGNSITAGTVTPGAVSLASVTSPAKTFTKYTVAVYGNSSLQRLNAAATDVDPKYDPRTYNNFVTLLVGINDLSAGTPADTVNKRLRLYWQGRKALGWKVIASTLISCQYVTDVKRDSVNAYIRANWSTYADALADYSANSNLGGAGAYSNLTYFIDGVHPSAAGSSLMGAILKIKVDSLAALMPSNKLYAKEITGGTVTGINSVSIQPDVKASWSAPIGFNGGLQRIVAKTTSGSLTGGWQIDQFSGASYRTDIASDNLGNIYSPLSIGAKNVFVNNTVSANDSSSVVFTGGFGKLTYYTDGSSAINGWSLSQFSGAAYRKDLWATSTGLLTAPSLTASRVIITNGSNQLASSTITPSQLEDSYNDRLKWDGGATGLTAATGRTSLGGTTIGQNLFTLTNPSAITFPRYNADNSVSALNASDFRTAIGAGTSSTSGTVTNLSVVTANGISGSVATSTTTPAITLTLGAITPTTVTASGAISGTTVNASDGFRNEAYFGGGGFRALVPANLTSNNTNYFGLSNGSTAVINASTQVTLGIGGNNVVDVSATGANLLLTPTAPTASAGTSTPQLATTAFVMGQASSGTYTPTLTNGTNVSSTSPIICHYKRIGNEVFVQGRFTLTITSVATNSVVGISLPIASNLSATGDLSGNGTVQHHTDTAMLLEDTANDRATCTIYPVGNIAGELVAFSFSYTVK